VSADFEFIKEFARLEPNNPMADFSQYQNILFIHTGGLYGLFPKAEEMSF